MNVQVFNYEGSPITFQRGESVMVNATQMAKGFDKRPVDWLKNQQTKEFLDELSNVRNLTFADLVIVREGAPHLGGGTWFHEDVAMEFARWLSPSFAIWCNDRIKELLTEGVTTVRSDDEAILHAMKVLQKRVEDSRQKIQMLEGENEHLYSENERLAPKAQYTDEVLQSDSTYTFTQIAKELDFKSVGAFTTWLMAKRIAFRQSGTWLLTSKYAGKGYTTSRTYRYYKSDGTPASSTSTVWTEIGRMWLHEQRSKEN